MPYERVRLAMLRVDPAAVALRYGATVHRRVYNVRGPNALWHIDGNHKLIAYVTCLYKISDDEYCNLF